MNAEIKERIDMINRGEVPEGYKKTKVGIIPREWEVKKMNGIAERIRRKNDGSEYPVLTISSLSGFLDQSDRFNKVIAGKNITNYILLKKNEFAYNKGNSKTYPYGCIFRLEEYEKALVPNVYYCFKIINGITEFYKHYFVSGILNEELSKLINTGVRNDGLLNLPAKDFFSSTILKPSKKEQQKIAQILSTWDKAIELKEKLIEEKKEQKKGLMQSLLTGKVRLPGFEGEWEEIELKELGRIVTGTTPNTKEKKYYENGKYPWITPTDIDDSKYISNSERLLTEEGIEKGRFVPAGSLLVTCIASIGKNAILETDGSCNQQINAIFPSNVHSNEFLYYLIELNVNYLKSYAGTSATSIINKKTFQNLKFLVPPLQEQKAIANILSTADKEIELHKQELEQLKLQKKGLMQLLLTGKVRVDY